MSDWRQQHALVIAALRRLGRDPATTALTSRRLAGGLSGSSVHHLDLARQAMVLKVTPPGDDHQLMVRAGREVLFYRDVATLVPVLVPRVLGLDLNETEGAVLLWLAARLLADVWIWILLIAAVVSLVRLGIWWRRLHRELW